MKKYLLPALLILSSCGPVATRVYSPPGVEEAKQVQQKSQAAREAQRFVYQPATHDCRNAMGLKGYNAGNGPCSLITDLGQLKDASDLRGSMFFQLNVPVGIVFSNLNLTDTVWVEVTGKQSMFQNSDLTNAKFISCKID